MEILTILGWYVLDQSFRSLAKMYGPAKPELLGVVTVTTKQSPLESGRVRRLNISLYVYKMMYSYDIGFFFLYISYNFQQNKY